MSRRSNFFNGIDSFSKVLFFRFSGLVVCCLADVAGGGCCLKYLTPDCRSRLLLFPFTLEDYSDRMNHDLKIKNQRDVLNVE